eukprot:TRINITY_DN1052_c0_g1_i8.p1 TRINITY_DN1052_c0_g1~~TRINITY_DN1052_c0_g1_i8.p1  ORF type:complete len:143 (-),score=21.44 TRINITY_DN1052_c0_g1_i8:64-492(-)
MSRGWLHQTWKRTHQAAKDGDLDTIRAIAYKHGNVAALDADGRTPAHEAARLGHAHVLRALWPLGAERSLSARDPSGLLPAHFACMEGHEACLELSLIHISEPTRLLSISYAVFCLKKKKKTKKRLRKRNEIKNKERTKYYI